MPGQVAEAVMNERLQRLNALLQEQQEAFNRSVVGRIAPVLIEKTGRNDGQVGGRSPWLQPVHIEGSATLIGQILPVRIEAATRGSLSGSLVLEPA
jgi:tRNA-2-methylthio-N6-dimethylallyladenosine synthase